MAAVANLVHETSTTTGTGSFTLTNVNGKNSFSNAFGTGGTDVFEYFISNQDASEWERGTGSMSDATTLVRDTVLESTNSDAAVDFSAGTKDITNDVPADNQLTTEDIGSSVQAPWTYASEVTLAGTTDDLATGIPSGVNEIEIFIDNPDAANETSLSIQLGDSGGYEATGYIGSCYEHNSATQANSTTDFPLAPEDIATPSKSGNDEFIGMYRLAHYGSNEWYIEGKVRYENSGGSSNEGWMLGRKTLSGELTQIQIVSAQSLTGGTAVVRYR